MNGVEFHDDRSILATRRTIEIWPACSGIRENFVTARVEPLSA